MKNIIETIQFNLKHRCKVKPESKILIGLSGGADSVTLLNILLSLGYQCQAAHCNFHLRADESDRDEAMVRQICISKGIPLHVAHFDTKKEAGEAGISIEMAARRLRYNWFRTLMQENHLKYTAIGHHADDSAETFFLNLTRGTGVKGLSGIRYRNEAIIRPMLDISRDEIEAYCLENHITYVNDSTNAEEHYLRNKIRHSVIPVFKEINPSFLQTMMGNMQRMEEMANLLADAVDSFKQEAVAVENNNILISNKILQQSKHKKLVLFEMLNQYGFSASVIDNIIDCLEEEKTGRQFFSTSHRLILDRYNIILLPRDKEEEKKTIYVQRGIEKIERPTHMTICEYEKADVFEIKRSQQIALLDADLIQFPLALRRWQEGDIFKPLGLNGFKKLSDYFIDKKYSLHQKENMWLLLSGDDIVWLVGERIDDRYKITNRTRKILEIQNYG